MRLFSVALLLSVPLVSQAAPVQWPVGSGGNDHLYQLVIGLDFLSWNEARTQAQALGTGWDLVTLTSLEESDFVKSLFSNNPAAFNPTQLGSNFVGPFDIALRCEESGREPRGVPSPGWSIVVIPWFGSPWV
jgi:hypothetical protein